MADLPPEVKWARALGRDFTRGNTLTSFVDGRTALTAIYHAIQTTHKRSDFIYLLGWWLDLDVPLLWNRDKPEPKSTLRDLLPPKAKAGVQIRVMLWSNWGKALKPHDSPGDLAAIAADGTDISAYYTSTLAQLAKDPSTDPSPLAARQGQSNFEICNWINNDLEGAAAIPDWFTPMLSGSHHQKMMCVRGSEGVYGLCGGVDINADRVKVVTQGKGEPLHDVHCEVRGPAAADLVQVFVKRWDMHPWAADHDRSKGPLLGRDVTPQRGAPSTVAGQFVRVAATMNRVNPEDLFKTKRRACQLDRGTRDALLGAIANARRFIYLEDQYLTSLTVADALGAAAKNVNYVLALITGSEISDLPQRWQRRKAFIERARSKGLGDKLFVYYLVDPLHPADRQETTYVHAKTWIFDDELAYVGSANVNNRGLSSDNEVGVIVCDKRTSATPPYGFAKDLRIRLWKRHLGFDVIDGYNGIDAWKTPHKPQTPGAYRVEAYNPNGGTDDRDIDRLPWEVVDPDLEGLQKCEAGVPQLRELLRKSFGG